MTEQPGTATCPHCRAHLDDAVIERGICAGCGKSLAAHLEQTLAADDDAQHEQVIATLDSPPVDPGSTADPETSTHDGQLFEQTLEVGPAAESAAAGERHATDATGRPETAPRHEAAAPPQNAAETIEQSTPAGAAPTAADFGTTQPPAAGADRSAETMDDQSRHAPDHAEAGADATFGPTMEVDPFAPLDDAQLTQMWSPSINSDSRPTTSLKPPSTGGRTAGGRTTSISATNLVIQTRAFGQRQGDTSAPTGAGPDYEVLNLLGEGGMGVVYAARQGSIDRTVAIKMLKSDAAGDERLRGKFLVEAVVTGDLEHPNIVPIYDLGENEQGSLFYSMKCVSGTPWDEVIKEKSLQENIETLMKVADAVAFAHSRGVVHRDLKPENVMLGGFGEVLVMDWGLALTEDNRASSGMGGTPAYMAPEMAGGPMNKVGPASDIYLLGAILYEIANGLRPHTGKTVMDCLKNAADNVIQPTERTGELVNIALKAMATNIEDRYATVADMQAAIRDYQSHAESIALTSRAAEDLAEAERTGNYQTYSRALFGFQEAVTLWPGNEQARAGVDEAKQKYATAALDKADYDLGLSLLDRVNPQHAGLYLKIEEARRERDARVGRLRTAKRIGVALVALILLIVTVAAILVNEQKKIAETNEAEAVKQTGIAEQERDKALAAEEKEKQARQQEELAKEAALLAEKEERLAKEAALESEEQERIAKEAALEAEVEERKAKEKALAAEEKERKAKQQEEYAAYLARIGLAVESIERNAFDKARDLLAACPDRFQTNWEWKRLDHLCSLDERRFGHAEPLETVAYSPDGKRFASGGWDGKVRIWDIENAEQPICEIDASSGYVFALALFSFADESDTKVDESDTEKVVNWIAIGTNERGDQGGRGKYLQLWNASSGEHIATFEGHTDAVISVIFSRDGSKLLTASYDGTARLWNVASPDRPAATFSGHDNGKTVRSARFSPDEQRIVTASDDGSAIVWSAVTGQRLARFREHTGPVYAAVFAPDGNRVISGGRDGRLLTWDPRDAKPYDFRTLTRDRNNPSQSFEILTGHRGPVRAIAFSPAATGAGGVPIQTRIVSAGDDNTVRIWDAESKTLYKTLRGHGGPVRACCFSPDGTRVISASYDTDVKIWNIADYHEQFVLRGHRDAVLSASYDTDGARIVTAGRDRTAKIWDALTGTDTNLPLLHQGHEFLATSAVFFNEGNRVVTAAADNSARVWDAASGAELLRLSGTGGAGAVAVSHDGRWILTGSDKSANGGYSAKLWDAASGKVIQTPCPHSYEVTAIAFSHDDRLILTGDYSGRCQLWDLEAGAELWSARNHTRKITAAIFTPDDRRVLTSSTDNTVAQWDVETGKEIGPLRLKHPKKAVTSMSAGPNGRYVLTSCADGVVRLWDASEVKIVRRWPDDEEASDEIGDDLADELFTSAALSPDGQRVVTVGEVIRKTDEGVTRVGSRIRLWDVRTGREITFGGSNGRPRPLVESIGDDLFYWSATFAPDGNSLLALRAGDAEWWDLDTGQPRGKLSSHGAVAGAAFSPDGQRIVTASWDTTARIWNSRTGTVQQKLEGGHSGRLHSSVFSPDGRLVLTCGDDATALLWGAETGQVVRRLEGHAGPIHRAVFSPDGTLVATASDDGTARIWETESGRELDVLSGHKQAVLEVEFSSHDPQLVVTCGEDDIAIVWNITKPEAPELVLKGHSDIVTSAAFSPDGLRVVTGSEDTTAKIWDVKIGDDDATANDSGTRKANEILTLKGHTAPITTVAFSPDGTQVLTASRDATAIIWPASR